MKYKLSVISPSFNQGDFIKDNIESVMHQNYNDIEHIIIDGGSTDNTLEIIKRYNHLHWISEKDTGAANAINKGLHLCNGDVITWLNTDDYYYPDVIGNVMEIFNKDRSIRMIISNVNIVDANKKILYNEKIKGFEINSLIHKNADVIRQAGIFFKKELIEETGYLDERLKCAFDYDLFIRMLRLNKPVYLDKVIAAQRDYDDTLTRRLRKTQGLEIIKVSRNYGAKFYDYIVIFNFIRKVLGIKVKLKFYKR